MPVLVCLAWASGPGSSEAQQGIMHNCPSAGKWAIVVWAGESGTAAADALATCGVDAVDAAYSLDSQTGGWLRWFSGRPEISTLETLNEAQAVFTLGSAAAQPTPTPTPTPPPWAIPVELVNDTGQSASGLHVEATGHVVVMNLVENAPGCGTASIAEPPHNEVDLEWPDACVDPGESVWLAFTGLAVPGGFHPGEVECFNWSLLGTPLSPCTAPSPTTSPTPTPTPTVPSLENCPQPENWAMSVWNGQNDASLEQASATCSGAALAAAYYLDPASQSWLRWFAGRPEITTLSKLGNLQGVIALGTPRVALGDERLLSGSERDGNYEIYAMNPDGTAQTNLTNNAANDGRTNEYYPNLEETQHAWSPDGSRIAFVSYRDGNGEIYVMNADGSGQTNLTNNPWEDLNPTWSPDGTKIAFDSRLVDDKMDIYVMNADGTGQANLTNSPGFDYGPRWSPDGSRIAFVSERDGNQEIYLMNADGTGQSNLTNGTAFDNDPRWSPDGTKIAFVSHEEGVPSANYEIYVMNADGTGQTNLTNNPAGDLGPHWSPDGTKIAYESDMEIWVMSADGAIHKRLTDNPAPEEGMLGTGMDIDPVWSADGSRIAFVSARDGNFQVYVMNADGTGQINLSRSLAKETGPVWSP
jgi:Tol biopolymer transport system component